MTSRAPTVDDAAAVAALISEATPENARTESEVRLWLTSPAGDGVFRLFEDDEGRPVAYSDLRAPPEGGDRAWADVQIPPRHLEPTTVDAVVGWVEGTAAERGHPLLRVSVGSASPLGATLAERGYRPVRRFFQMRIDLDALPSEGAWPAGIAVRAFRPGDERAVYEADQEAFADHWEFTPDSFEEWEHYLVRIEDFDPALWFLALDGGEIAGVSLCRSSRPGRPGVGWVRVLAVRRPWRRRGLGLALLLHSFGEFWKRGTRTVGLGVDGENTTGAVRLYEKAGMRVEHRFDTYERRLQ